MNERIQKLAEQCTDLVEVTNPDTGITHTRAFFDKERFAELIVRECIQVGGPEMAGGWQPDGLLSDWNNGDYVFTQEQMKKFAELIVRECADTVLGFHNQFGDSARDEIRERFGVEG